MVMSIPRGAGCLHRSWICWKRFLSNKSKASNAIVSTENATRRVESLALERVSHLPTLQAESLSFSNASSDMTPMQVIRGMNAFANIGFCNKELLVTLGERMDDLCEQASPKRISHLITLLKRMNITHPTVVEPVMQAVKNHLHNYVDELSDIIRNTSHLGFENQELVELFRTQALLHFEHLGRGSIRCAEALSRFRHDGCALLNRVKDAYISNPKDLTLKQQMYLLAAFSRCNQTGECNKLIKGILSYLSSISLTDEDLSRILTLQNSIGVVVPKMLDMAMNDMEVRMDDAKYLNNTFPYHFYTLTLLGKGNRKTLIALLQRASEKGIKPTTATAATQFLYAISLLMRRSDKGKIHVDDKLIQGLIDHLESSYQRLTIQRQEELYEALICRKKLDDLPPGLAHFVSSKIPSSIPAMMCTGESDQQLAAIGGVNYMFLEKNDGSREILLCVNESGVLTVVTRGSSVTARPCKLHNACTLESLLSGLKSDSFTPVISYRISAGLESKLLL